MTTPNASWATFTAPIVGPGCVMRMPGGIVARRCRMSPRRRRPLSSVRRHRAWVPTARTRGL